MEKKEMLRANKFCGMKIEINEDKMATYIFRILNYSMN